MSTDAKHFEVALARLDGHVRVKLRGDLDYQTTLAHAHELQELADLRTRVVLDLAAVQFIDSSGIAFLLRLARVHEDPVRLEYVPAGIRSLFKRTGLAEVFDIDAD